MSSSHELPNGHVYDGVHYMDIVPVDVLDRLKVMPFRPDDILVVTYPKAGTAWISEIVSQLIPISEENQKLPLIQRVPLVGFHLPHLPPVIDMLESMKTQRIFGTHLKPYLFKEETLKTTPKVIVFMRNPKDCLVSYYNFYKATPALGSFVGSFDDFWQQLVITDKLCFGGFTKFNADWWQFKDESNFLFLTYEGMKKDPKQGIAAVARHLDVQLSDEELDKLVEKTSFNKMSQDTRVNRVNTPKAAHDSSVSKYLRKGEVGDWKNTFTKEQSDYIDKSVY